MVLAIAPHSCQPLQPYHLPGTVRWLGFSWPACSSWMAPLRDTPLVLHVSRAMVRALRVYRNLEFGISSVDRMEHTHSKIRSNVENAQQRQKMYYDKKKCVKNVQFTVGDWVRVKLPVFVKKGKTNCSACKKHNVLAAFSLRGLVSCYQLIVVPHAQRRR
ncbi:hypothetical protein NDU88_000249 [Pleurodeles waltl]|uniref:Uncharacterized protein n=1 Tax=Pleurodeles waltl TaxID=8319 RepID=A0AAV7Q557_PLEWA|nr:hypothetical protein NDU88_000249 [Pleurodeles waltl]